MARGHLLCPERQSKQIALFLLTSVGSLMASLSPPATANLSKHRSFCLLSANNNDALWVVFKHILPASVCSFRSGLVSNSHFKALHICKAYASLAEGKLHFCEADTSLPPCGGAAPRECLGTHRGRKASSCRISFGNGAACQPLPLASQRTIKKQKPPLSQWLICLCLN